MGASISDTVGDLVDKGKDLIGDAKLDEKSDAVVVQDIDVEDKAEEPVEKAKDSDDPNK